MIRFFLVWLLLLVSMTASSADNAGEYRLGPGDVVKVSVYDHPDLSGEIQINRDGDVTFPLIGKIHLQGLSYTDAELHISKALQDGKFIRQANVNVLVTQYRSQRVSVLGEVYKPGRYALDSMATLVDVLAIAGGVNGSGGDRVVLIRGEQRQEYLVSKLMNGGGESDRAARVFGGDVIFVPRMQQFYVYGEVNRPGAYRLEPGVTVMQAISLAGGYSQRASHGSFELHRPQAIDSGKVVSIGGGDVLKEGDVIYVRESLF